MTFSENVRRVFPYLLLLVYGVFTCGYFIFQDYNVHYRFFARFIFIISIVVVIRSVPSLVNQTLFKVIGIYLLYLLASGLWSDPPNWFRLGQETVLSVYIISFIAITSYLIGWNADYFERLLQSCVVFAAGAALLTILTYFQGQGAPAARMTGVGSLTNINEFSNVYGVFALLAMSFSMQAKRLAFRYMYLSAVFVFVTFAWFGQSRTAFVAMSMTLIVLVVLSSTEKRWFYGLALAALLGVLGFCFMELLQNAFLRGEGLRPLIWKEVLHEILAAPVFGHGIAAIPQIEVNGRSYETAHNAFLQVLWHGGVIGFCVFVWLLVTAFRSAWALGRQKGEFLEFSMLLFATGVMMTGVDTLIYRPRDQWILFWFPLALLVGYRQLSTAGATGKTRQG